MSTHNLAEVPPLDITTRVKITFRDKESPSQKKIIDIIWRKSVRKLMERFMILKELFTVKFLFDSCTKRRVMKRKFLYIKKLYICRVPWNCIYVLGRYSLVFIPPLIICFFSFFFKFFSSPYLDNDF